MKSQFIRAAMAPLLFFAVASSQAQQPVMDGSSAAALEWKTQNGIRYICGGVGAEEADDLKAEARKRDLMLTFASTSGDYLGDAHVTIADSRGRPLLDITCGGPIMLADLPKSGRYRVQAELAGRSTGGTVDVSHKASGKTLALVWPREKTEMPAAGDQVPSQR
jgi:hypothetical protein